MADKSFGLKQVNLIGASGTPRIESPNNLNINATNVAISTDMSVGGTITVGNSFIKSGAVGLGTTDTTGRNAGVSTATGTLIYNSTTTSVEVWNGSSWDTLSNLPFTASSPTVTADTSTRPGWAVFSFTSPGSLIVSTGTVNAEYLVIAGGGGGGGGSANAGGAGAGGYRLGASSGTSGRGSSAESLLTLSPGTYTIQVGGGGAPGPTSAPKNGGQGTPSFITNPGITSITSIGGGFGGGYPANGGPGGCGGGGSQNQPTQDRGAGTPGQGYDGGLDTTVSGSESGGGGGGAGGQGQDTIAPYTGAGGGGGAGGIGVESSITGSPVKRGGGGTGGSHSPPGAGPNPVPGGPWGGGDGAWGATPATNGTANTGGGGGGGGDGPRAGGSGGSGIVIIAYPTT